MNKKRLVSYCIFQTCELIMMGLPHSGVSFLIFFVHQAGTTVAIMAAVVAALTMAVETSAEETSVVAAATEEVAAAMAVVRKVFCILCY